MGTILTFHLNHSSLLLIYRYSILHISLKFGVQIYQQNRLHAIAFWQYLATSVAMATLFMFLGLVLLLAFTLFQSYLFYVYFQRNL